MKAVTLTNEFRDEVVIDALTKLDLSPLVDTAHAAGMAVRAVLIDRLAATVSSRDMAALRRHDSADFVDRITVRVGPTNGHGRPGTRGVHVSFLRMADHGEEVGFWRRPVSADLGVWVPQRWRHSPSYGVSSDSGGEHMPEPVRAALEPLALAYDVATEAVRKARRAHRETLTRGLEVCRTLDAAERVWPGTTALWREHKKTQRTRDAADYAWRETCRAKCAAIPVGRMVVGAVTS